MSCSEPLLVSVAQPPFWYLPATMMVGLPARFTRSELSTGRKIPADAVVANALNIAATATRPSNFRNITGFPFVFMFASCLRSAHVRALLLPAIALLETRLLGKCPSNMKCVERFSIHPSIPLLIEPFRSDQNNPSSRARLRPLQLPRDQSGTGPSCIGKPLAVQHFFATPAHVLRNQNFDDENQIPPG